MCIQIICVYLYIECRRHIAPISSSTVAILDIDPASDQRHACQTCGP
jgi:hypothetical protein